jgi:hypothetical protein
MIPGGPELLEWFGDVPEFADGEIVCLSLDRSGSSELRVFLEHFGKSVVIAFKLSDWIDVDVRGFSHQNVLGGLKLRRPEERGAQPWELGVGLKPGEFVIELEPCFGAYGNIRASISRITIEETAARARWL